MRLTCLLFVAACPALATTLTLTGVDWARGGSVELIARGVTVNDFAGVILADFTPASGPVQSLSMMCVDLFTEIALTGYTSDPYLPAPWRQEDRAAWLYVNYFAAVDTVVEGQALQLAVWDIVHDGGDGPSAGQVQASLNTPLDAQLLWQDYLTLSQGHSSFAASIYYNISNGVPAQHLISTLQSNSLSAVPEPGTLMAGVGLAALALARRRRNHTARD